jgi:hypothetical protein
MYCSITASENQIAAPGRRNNVDHIRVVMPNTKNDV